MGRTIKLDDVNMIVAGFSREQLSAKDKNRVAFCGDDVRGSSQDLRRRDLRPSSCESCHSGNSV